MSLGRIIMFTLAFIVLGFAVGKSYLSFFVFDEKYYAKLHYSWRVQFANKEMCKEVWKFIPSNRYHQEYTKDLYELIKYAQHDLNLFDAHPEHFPRQPKCYHTHGGLHPFNKKLLQWRKDCNKIDNGLDAKIINGENQLSNKKTPILAWY